MNHLGLQKFLLGLVGVLVIALGISLHTATTATVSFRYAVTDLGTLGGTCNDTYSCGAYGINDAGQIVGTSTARDGYFHGFFWQNGQQSDLGDSLFPARINNAGQVVGQSLDGPGAFKWENGTVTDLVTLNGYSFSISNANDINNAGQVVGQSGGFLNEGGYEQHAVIWNNSSITDLSGNTLRNCKAHGINNHGQVVGYIAPTFDSDATDARATLWDNGTIVDLGTFGGTESTALDINDKGQIIGMWGTDNNLFHSFLWQNSQVTDLGTLKGNPIFPLSINNQGKVVGFSYSSTSTDRQSPIHAFVRRDGLVRDLNNLIPPNSGWVLQAAYDINNKGQIVGYGLHNGQNRAFLATPVTVTQ